MERNNRLKKRISRKIFEGNRLLSNQKILNKYPISEFKEQKTLKNSTHIFLIYYVHILKNKSPCFILTFFLLILKIKN